MAVEIASAYVNIIPSFRGLQRSLDNEIRGVDMAKAGRKGGDDYKRGFGGAAKALTGVLAGAFAAVKIGDFAKDAINQASDLQEVGTKMNAIFGKDGAAAIQQFASTSAKSLGQSGLAAQNAAATFGVFGKAAGLTGKDLSGFSTDLVSLSSDMASFSNTTPEEAIEALASGLRGEAEPLRKYGILLDDATLRQEALSLGLVTTTKEALTPQQKVLAAQSAILKQTSDAQGDFARTSGGLANQQRILSAQWTDMKGKLGAALLPAVTSVVTALNEKMFPAFDKVGSVVSDSFGKIGPTIKQVSDIFTKADFTGGGLLSEDSPIVDFLFTLRDLFDDIKPIFKEVAGTLGKAFVDVWKTLWPQIQKLVPVVLDLMTAFNPISLIFKALLPQLPKIAQVFGDLARTLAGALSKALDVIVPLMQRLMDKILPVLMGLIEDLVPFFVDLAETIGEVAEVVLDGLVAAFEAVAPLIETIIDVVAELVPVFVDTVMPAIMSVVDAIKPAIESILDALIPVIRQIVDFLVPVIKGLVPIFKTVFQFIADTIKNIVKVFQGVIDFITGIFTGDWEKVWEGVKKIFGAIWDQIKEIFGTLWELISTFFREFGPKIWEIIKGAATWMAERGGEFLGWLWQGIQDALPAILTWFGELAGKLWGKILELKDWLLDRGEEFIGWIWQGIRDGAVALFQWFADLPAKIGAWITSAAEDFVAWGKGIIDGIVEGILSVPNAIWNAIVESATGGAGDFGSDYWANLLGGAGGGVLGGGAGGGVLPGYSPGVDSVPTMLSPGEGVMVPEFVRAVGPAWVYAMNRAARRGRGVGGRILGMPQFAAGGVLGMAMGKQLFNNPHILDLLQVAGTGYLASRRPVPVAYNASAGTEQWRGLALQALAMTGQSPLSVDALLFQMQTESGGNPNAINLWDINAQRGTPSIGLMQVIGPTFAAYAMPGFNSNIYDPLSNILASIRYAIDRYGSLGAAYRGVAYDSGGWLPPGGSGVNLLNRPEAVLTPAQSAAYVRHAQALENGAPNIRVFIGDTELKDIVGVEVDHSFDTAGFGVEVARGRS